MWNIKCMTIQVINRDSGIEDKGIKKNEKATLYRVTIKEIDTFNVM